MKRHLLVIEEGTSGERDLKAFVDSLDDGARMYVVDGRACFLKSDLSASEISSRFQKVAPSTLFFIADISSSHSAGKMLEVFWDFMKAPSLQTAAE